MPRVHDGVERKHHGISCRRVEVLLGKQGAGSFVGPHMKTLALLAFLPAFVAAADKTLSTFTKLPLEQYYWSEGAAFGDINKDGRTDAVCGPYWSEGPEFTKKHEIYPPNTTFKVKQDDGTERMFPGFEGRFGRRNAYSTDNFFAFAHDCDGDGWNDVLTYGLPGTPAYLYLNPHGKEGHWMRHQVLDEVDNESPTFMDIDGDGKPEIICNNKGNFGFAKPDWNNVTAKWTFTPITGNGKWARFTHGLGIGDLNADGRLDIVFKDGWLEQPASPGLWKMHATFFAPSSSQMYVDDVNGDGRADIITALAAHGFGMAWYEQLAEKEPDGGPKFRGHVFMNKEANENRYGVTFSEIHAVELADVDGDGLKDIITGKCFWAHGPTGAPDSNAPAVLYWFKNVRLPGGGVDWVPHLIDNDSGVGRQISIGDVNDDKRPDIIICNKKGAFVFTSKTQTVSEEQWQKAQPKLLYPDAEKKNLNAKDVIVHTARSRDVAKASNAAGPPIAPGGMLPIGADGKPLNTDFETGTLQDWTTSGKAFDKQPVLGDTVFVRRPPMASRHVGKYWTGTYENGLGDMVTGTLTSKPFKLTQPWAAFLFASGAFDTTRVELVNAADQSVLVKVTGKNRAEFGIPDRSMETMAPVLLDLKEHVGKEVFLRVVDEQPGGAWGHLNFDDFKLYAEKPQIKKP